MPKKPGPKEGAAWKHVKASALSADCQAFYAKYAQMIRDSKIAAQELQDTVTQEWNTKFPNGIDGKVCAFRVANGNLMYVMKKMPKQKKAKRNTIALEKGDDVFAFSPSRQRVHVARAK